MNVFPLFFNLTGKTVVVVGGGTVAERKVRLLLRAGARVTVVAPEQTSWLRASAQAGALSSLFTSFVAEHIREAATAQMTHSGFAGRLVVMGDPDIRIGDGRLEWVDGGIVRDIAQTAGEIDRQIRAYLAAFNRADHSEEHGR